MRKYCKRKASRMEAISKRIRSTKTTVKKWKQYKSKESVNIDVN